MLRVSILILLAAASWAQTGASDANRPPTDLDRALRARITAFYEMLLNHQYRRAEELVDPDSRDIYYENDKPRCMAYSLVSIKYSPDFTRADVVVTIKTPPTSSMVPIPMDVPAASIWRLRDGAWYWSIPKISVTDLLRKMTGGSSAEDVGQKPADSGQLLRAGSGNASGALDMAAVGAAPQLPNAANLPAGMGRTDAIPTTGKGEASLAQFAIDKAEVVLRGNRPQRVTISNNSKGPMTLFVLGKIPNIEATFDHAQIKPGEKAVLSVQAAEGAKDGMLVIGVTETKDMVTLPVTVK